MTTDRDDFDRVRFDESIELAMTQLPLTPEPDRDDREGGVVDHDELEQDDDREVGS